MNDSFLDALNSLANTSQVDREVYDKFLKRIKSNPKRLKHDQVLDHFCVGGILINRSKHQVLLGRHIKSDHWLGPGGHIEPNESPIITIIRECQEEIGYKMKHPILYNFIHFHNVGKQTCKEHYDFFFIEFIEDLPIFTFDHGEFTQLKWFSFEDSLKQKLFPQYRALLHKLYDQIRQGSV